MEYENCFDKSYCLPKGNEMNYEGRLILLKPERLAKEFQQQRYQPWIAYNGNGCTFAARGQAVFALCLADGEKAHWERYDFLGVADLQQMPDWVKKCYEEYQAKNDAIEIPPLSPPTKDEGIEI